MKLNLINPDIGGLSDVLPNFLIALKYNEHNLDILKLILIIINNIM